jgi:hypothetical protein
LKTAWTASEIVDSESASLQNAKKGELTHQGIYPYDAAMLMAYL